MLYVPRFGAHPVDPEVAASTDAVAAALGRAGRVHVERDAKTQVWVGGDCVRVIEGEVRL